MLIRPLVCTRVAPFTVVRCTSVLAWKQTLSTGTPLDNGSWIDISRGVPFGTDMHLRRPDRHHRVVARPPIVNESQHKTGTCSIFTSDIILATKYSGLQVMLYLYRAY